jgi:hypothetical protein
MNSQLVRAREGQLLTRVVPWVVAMTDGIHDTAIAPDAAAALASPPAAAVLAELATRGIE